MMRSLAPALTLVLVAAGGCDDKPIASTKPSANASAAPVASTNAKTSPSHAVTPAHAERGPIPGPPLAAENAADLQRFPNEKPLAAIADHIQQDMNVRKGPNKDTGDIVVPLRAGTPITKVAKRGQWFLITFADPKDKAKTLAGWTWEQAFFHPAGPGDEKRLCECWSKVHDADSCDAVAGRSKAECDRTFGNDCDKLVRCAQGEIHGTCLEGERLLLPHGVCAKVCKSNAGCQNDQICTDKLGTPSVCAAAQIKEDPAN